ncbi:hypothetical protein KR009_007160 [Drosophila setifemur]|nr:hypothetical protein KR009_007160 [Drosophila setifemur]
MFTLKCILLAAILVAVAQATIIIKPKPMPVQDCSKCNIYCREYVWALEDCVCRIFQNGCLLQEESDKRDKAGKTPLIPVSEKICKKFIKKKCGLGLPVVATFPIPAPCGCNGKKGSLENKKFQNLCKLNKYAAECSKRK